MADIKDLLRAFRQFIEFLRTDADIILLRNIETLRSTIIERIESGKDANGTAFSKYSDFKGSAKIFEGIKEPAAARNFIEKSIKSKTPIAYKDIRESVGLPTASKNFFFTGEMLNSIDKNLDSESGGEYKISLAPTDRENRIKLLSNEINEGEILGFSQQEIDNMILDIEDQLVKVLEKLIG